MKRKKVSRLEIATYLGVSYRTIHSRFNGKVPWEYSACVRIRDHFFPRTHIRIPVRNRGREGVREMRFIENEILERIGFDFYCDIANNIVKARAEMG